MDLTKLFNLEPHGPDTFVGIGPQYPWGGLYGGQIVAQALRAAALTVDFAQQVHSLRAYFIRRGDHTEPIRFEVDRIRNGRSFSTRRVVARQAIGAILNLEASFQIAETTDDLRPIPIDATLPSPDDLASDRWSAAFDRRWIPNDALGTTRDGAGRCAAWMRVTTELPADDQLLHRCWLAYLSDDLATDAVRAAHPQFAGTHHTTFTASLDHTIWYHRPMQADEWHLHDFSSHGYVGGRGLAIGHIFSLDGTHVATVAQEVLMRARQAQD
ncbi:MAG TPA: acyl-CoA thioesterase II [Acidimicrobiaceae bacterium]|nr:acyl-CoA thioesterase II [Acidimicrobiaceae bacterium]